MEQKTTHQEQLEYLKKIEGQVRGIQRMIEKERYCVDIITQLHSVIGALYRVENEIFKKHVRGCVAGSLRGAGADKKVEEIVSLFSKFRTVA
jgi:CsoR family transcriptional regulator, copper-sensing transcriptional repressor